MWISVFVYQNGAAQQDDEDDEALKCSVLHDEETDSPELRPDPPCSPGRVYALDRTAAVTA